MIEIELIKESEFVRQQPALNGYPFAAGVSTERGQRSCSHFNSYKTEDN
jgi:hypothetical protein